MASTQTQINEIPPDIKRILDNTATIELTGGIDDENLRGIKEARIPTIVTTEEGIRTRDFDKIIRCWVNPGSMDWNVMVRGGIQKVKGGSVRYLWRNREKGTFFDEATVGITFQSGNILPQYSTNLEEPMAYDYLGTSEMRASIHAHSNQGGYPLMPPGLDNFYSFVALQDSDPQTSTGSENFHIIYHNSHVFPGIILKGYFDPPGGVSFNENAEEGWSISWNATFTICSSTPKLHRLDDLRKLYGMMAEIK